MFKTFELKLVEKQKLVITMKTNDYVKYVTQQFVSYVDTPSEQRKAQKKERKKNKLPFANRWFGLVPYALGQVFNLKRKK